MQRHLETRVKEHKYACKKRYLEVCHHEHQWDQQHWVDWDGTRVLDRATRLIQLKIKRALRIERTPAASDSTTMGAMSYQAAESLP